jgi:hypothetical protein
MTRPSRARTGDTAAEGPSRSVRFGSVDSAFGSVDSAFVSTSDSIASNRDRRSIHPEGRPFGIETEDARAWTWTRTNGASDASVE